MAIYTGPYVGARSCTGTPQPGARGLMAWFLGAYGPLGGLNAGIYNCRTTRGGSATSLHGEGRAADLAIRPYSAGYGWDLARFLLSYSAELGIQCIIWDRRIWSSRYPHSGWRRYSGVNPHIDHLHVELTWAAARRSQVEMVRLLNHYANRTSSAAKAPEQKGVMGMSIIATGSNWSRREFVPGEQKRFQLGEFFSAASVKAGQTVRLTTRLRLEGLHEEDLFEVAARIVDYLPGGSPQDLIVGNFFPQDFRGATRGATVNHIYVSQPYKVSQTPRKDASLRLQLEGLNRSASRIALTGTDFTVESD